MLALLVVICLFEFSYSLQFGIPLFEYGYGVLIRPLIVLIETVLYYVIRNRITDRLRKWIWVHLICIMLATIVIPGVLMICSILTMGSGSVATERLLDRIRMGVYWALIIIGHIYFIMVLAKSFSAKQST